MEDDLETGPVIGHVQTDTFCEGCGYNLNTQAVTRDPRLGILICRCPECGRFAAAGRQTAAGRVWLNRIAVGMLAFWVLGLMGFFLLDSFFLGLIAYGHTVDQTFSRWDPYKNSIIKGRMELREFQNEDSDAAIRHRNEQFILRGIAVILALTAGVTFSVFFWHSRGGRRWLALLPAFVGCGVATIFWTMDPETELLREWGQFQIGAFFLLEMAATIVGIFGGRPLARFVLGIFLPPKACQHLVCLWTIDGKRLPAIPDRPTSAAPLDAALQTDRQNPAPTA